MEEFIGYLEEKYGTNTYESKISEDPDKIAKIFEYFGKEYNYGMNTKNGFEIERRIFLKKPLHKQND